MKKANNKKNTIAKNAWDTRQNREKNPLIR
jgi:hypothetical protein